jgi:hypothetical protein
VASQVKYIFQADVVAPVKVLHDQQERLTRRQLGKEMGHRCKKPTFFLLGIKSRKRQHRRKGRDESSHFRQEFRCDGFPLLCDLFGSGRHHVGTQQVEKRGIRERVIGLKAMALQVEETLLPGKVRCFRHESRLSNPRFTADKSHPSLSALGLFDEPL